MGFEALPGVHLCGSPYFETINQNAPEVFFLGTGGPWAINGGPGMKPLPIQASSSTDPKSELCVICYDPSPNRGTRMASRSSREPKPALGFHQPGVTCRAGLQAPVHGSRALGLPGTIGICFKRSRPSYA